MSSLDKLNELDFITEAHEQALEGGKLEEASRLIKHGKEVAEELYTKGIRTPLVTAWVFR